ncbi:sialoadhesin-like [Pempheris klunzingeri]|uniref:sialoadhesin-like n=1 Tax=Pempheris klunzingeri TaxID=3127111 RepID=UPI00397F36A2
MLTFCLRLSPPASLTVSPSRGQYFEYEELSVSCEQFGSGEWTVWRHNSNRLGAAPTMEPVLSQCGSDWGSRSSSSCYIKTVKESDSGVYWCESNQRHSSNAVNISITGGLVILHSPVLPVTGGQDVTLRCTTKTSSPIPADFYKDGTLIRTEPTGHMTIHNFSRSDEGSYKCGIGEESESSWLLLGGDSEPPSLTLLPDSSQLFEYEDVTLSCGANSSRRGWSIVRASANVLSGCGEQWGTRTSFGCALQTAKQSDSGVYWCQSAARQRSNSVSVSVHDQPVILQSPVLPVTEGQNVTLLCRTKTSSHLPAHFYKDGRLIGAEPTGHMTLRRVSRSDEGSYRCNISGQGESPPSWVYVTDPLGSAPSSAGLTPYVLMLIRRLVLVSPYFLSTVLLCSLCRHRPTGKSTPVSMTSPSDEEEGPDQPYDDVVADVTTEHHF